MKTFTVSPKDLIFFSSETSAQSGFDGRNFCRQHLRNFYQKSSEIQKSGPKSTQYRDFSPQNLLPSKISDGSKILFFEKYDSSASFCTSNQGHDSKSRKSQSDRSLRILRKNGFDFEIQKSEFRFGIFSKSANFDLT